jgi:hypothetical protein
MVATPQRDYCSSCTYFDQVGKADEPIGRCRRYPPGLVPASQIPHVITSERWAYPIVQASFWCGEHKRPPGETT